MDRMLGRGIGDASEVQTWRDARPHACGIVILALVARSSYGFIISIFLLFFLNLSLVVSSSLWTSHALATSVFSSLPFPRYKHAFRFFIAHRVQHSYVLLVGFHRILLTHALQLFAMGKKAHKVLFVFFRISSLLARSYSMFVWSLYYIKIRSCP